MRLAAYCRVSTEKDSQLESLENQKLFFEEYAKTNNYQLVKIYADEGISGKQTKNRKEFLKMLSDAENREFDIVAVKDISRFARNTVDFLTAVRRLKNDNIEVVFLSNNQSVLGSSEFVLTIFSAIAQEESANLSKRVKFGKKVNAQKGRVPNCIYGYTQIDTFNMQIKPDEAQTVNEIYTMYASRGFGFRKIAAELNRKGILTKKHCLWSAKTIKRVLTNPVYTGILQNNKTQTTDFLTSKRVCCQTNEYICHERPQYRIIDDETFYKVQQIISDRNTKSAKERGRYSSGYPLSSLIKCEGCGCSFTARRYTYKNTYVKWHCSGNYKNPVVCGNSTSVDQGKLLGFISDYLTELIGSKTEFAKSIADEFIAHGAGKAYLNTENAARIISRAETAKQRYKQMFTAGIISFEELKSALEKLDNEICIANNNLRCYENFNDNFYPELFSATINYLNLSTWSSTELREIINTVTVNKAGEVSIVFNKIN